MQQQIFAAAIFQGDTFVYTIHSPRAAEIYKMIIIRHSIQQEIFIEFSRKFKVSSKWEMFCNVKNEGSNKSKIIILFSLFASLSLCVSVSVFMSIACVDSQTIMLCGNENSICSVACISVSACVHACAHIK